MKRIVTILAAALVLAALAAQPATATSRRAESALLGELWTYLLETPVPDNPFAEGDPCIELEHRVLVPFAPLGTSELRCAVDTRTSVFVTPLSYECSTVEDPPFYGSNPRELRRCAADNLALYHRPTLSLDGRRVRLARVETGLLRVTFPDDPIIPTTEPTALSVGAAWVALLHPLRPGHHVLRIHAEPLTVSDATPVIDNVTILTVRACR